MKLKRDDVHYLVFEGGGGKGATYIGALDALEELSIIKHYTKNIGGREVTRLDNSIIKGIAGTSVGSITAVMIAAGYTSEEVKEFINSNITAKFLDTVKFGIMPTIYNPNTDSFSFTDPRLKENSNFVDSNWKSFINSSNKEHSLKNILSASIKKAKEINTYFFGLLLKWYLYYETRFKKETDEEENETEELTFLPSPKDFRRSKTLKEAIDKILNSSNDSLNSLKYEYGFFLGEGARKAIDELIEKKSGIKNCTFKQFYEEFGVDIVVTSFDLTSKQPLYFRNNEQWGDLCVADAVRMSISIPFVFKPVVMQIKNGLFSSFNNDMKTAHYFVDGGVANNFPLHIFDKEGSKELNKEVLGFVLCYQRRFNPFYEHITYFEFVEDVFLSIIKQTTRLQIKDEDEKEQVIELDPGNIKVLDFSFDKFPDEIIAKAKQDVLRYFED